jgi:hypothetical protein
MKLEQLRIANFKSIQSPATLDFKNLTFLYGPNSAGKSAVLDALDFIASIGSGKLCPGRVDALTNSAAKKQNQGIRLGVTVYIEGLTFEYIGASQFDELEHTHGALTEGAYLSFDIEFDGETYTTKYVSALSVGINGVEIVAFKNETTRLGPKLKLLSNDQTEAGPVRTILGLDGEWRINTRHPVAADILIDPITGSARSDLAFSNDVEGIRIVRGISYSFGPDSLDCQITDPQLSSSSLALILPPATADIISDLDQWSALYHDGRVRLLPPDPFPKDFYCHRTFLDSYGFRPDEIQAYKEFLQEEFSAENSAYLFSNLKEQREKISRFLSGVLTTISKSIHFPRVPGSRSAFDSQQPIHIKSHLDNYFSQEPFEKPAIRTGHLLRLPIEYSPLYEPSPRLISDAGRISPIVERLIAPYAMQIANGLGDKQKSDSGADFPNFVLRKYLHSLGKYRIEPRVYCVASKDMEDHEDPAGLAGSRLVYFSLSTNTGTHLAFSDVGSALGYIFPTLAALGEFHALAIEQPELHLHPLAQDQLADVFVHAANSAKAFPRRLIIESHSEIFLLRIAQRMAECYERRQASGTNISSHSEKLSVSPDQIRIYYFMPEKDGATSVEEMRFASNGTLIKTWPPGMFASDWTSGLDRLKLFSHSFSTEDAERVWPWISAVCDAEIHEWLKIAALLENLGPDMMESSVVVWAKITEKLLLDEILQPICTEVKESNHNLKEVERKLEETLKKDFLQKGHCPSLWWWEKTLSRVKQPRRNEAAYIGVLRAHLRQARFRKFWDADPSGGVIELIEKLRNVRNPAAHAGRAEPTKILEARPLIARGNQPGVLFDSLGLCLEWRKGLIEVR